MNSRSRQNQRDRQGGRAGVAGPGIGTGAPAPLGLADLGELRARLKAEATRQAEAARAEAARQEAARREADLFRRSIGEVTPLPDHGRVQQPRPDPEPIAQQFLNDEREALAASLSDEIDVERLLEHDEALSFRRPGIAQETLARLRRGQWVAQARLDLHGLRREEARDAVARFLPQAVRDGLRCVRIIHGKGLGSINRKPVLKDKVLRWLVQRDEVIAFCQAPPHAGGAGALLVLLRPPPHHGALPPPVSRRP